MRFLANENFPAPSTVVLRKAGYDVTSIQESHSGISDGQVLEIAKNELRIILTFDKDHGELIFRGHLVDPPPVVFFRYRGKAPFEAGMMLIETIRSGTDIENCFTVMERDGIRQRIY